MEKQIKLDHLNQKKHKLEAATSELNEESIELKSKLEKAANFKRKLEKDVEKQKIKCDQLSFKLQELKHLNQKVKAIQAIEDNRREIVCNQLIEYEAQFKNCLKIVDLKTKSKCENKYLFTKQKTMENLMKQKLNLERESFEIKENFKEQLRELEYLENSNYASSIQIKKNLNTARVIRMKKTVQMNQKKLDELKKTLESS